MPATVGHVGFHLVVKLGIVLFHPGILHGSLKVEDVIGVLLQEEEILGERVTYMVTYGCLDVPVPLGV